MMKIFEYKGILLRVPETVQYIAIDGDGAIKGYTEAPDTSGSALSQSVEFIPVTVLNPGKSLIEVTKLKEFAPLVLHEIVRTDTKPFRPGDKYILQTKVNEEDAVNAEVHVVVNCYTPGSAPWVQVLHVHVNGLSIDNKILTSVVEVLHDLHI